MSGLASETISRPAERRDWQRLRLFAVLAGLYLAQGIPGYLLVAAVPPIMRELGVSRTAIGMLAVLMIPLTVKFLWAPLVDRIRPMAIGHRRGWILPTQIGTVIAIAALALVEPTNLKAIFAIGFAIAVLTSTQDIATDGYATLALRQEDRAVGNAIQGGAVALSVIVGGTVSLLLYGWVGWQAMVLTIAAVSALPLIAIAFMPEDTATKNAEPRAKPSISSFLKRPEAVTVLMIALTYRASEGLVKSMEGSYLVDVGLPLSAIGYLSGISAATADIAGSFIAAMLVRRSGAGRTLLLLGALRTICFLLFALHAAGEITGIWTLLGAAGFQTLIRYMEIVALYSLFMAVSSKDQPGTDFTILSCAQIIIYLIGSMMAGAIADRIGYGALFTLSTLVSGLAVVLTAHLLSRLSKKSAGADFA
ncbi:RhtX/FptX family siderophore transporter [Mesorhizobium sp. M7A.F.Ca.MR.245.00.0.0]|uniref:RhtX/FptX family siderophore transporter n=1 Tax=Mesorhizobium sp. M7A.F.Ca.MR.245.00.0.0 TaxID=2496778 RepID=UPI000FCAF32C|nr:RhtX/FptX family siderophore transporter [Mesorhizobium sp. M7A.F.Ca.MR.245.00.0.0]RUV22788.1 RhtX/FptX family siderophore transporter [Mesorhizobium sp. M7A.F.Ca.MR.245.00.0.0]